MSRIVILTEGRSNPLDAKTASGVVRYRPDEVVAFLDSTQKGKTVGEIFGVGGSKPFIATLSEVEADTLLIGIAPSGGGLPPSWMPILREAIERKMTVVSGLHYFLADDPELGPLAKKHGAKIHDVRKPPEGLTVSGNWAKDLPCCRVHTVGNDCNVGKMLTAIEVAAGLKKRGRRAEFVATGQTGIMISGWGMPIDRVVSDFVAGAIETLMIEHQSAEFLLIEGQGSLIHPLFSGVTLGLLHGCAPQALILCWEAGRTDMRHARMSMPPMRDVIRLYETMANVIRPCRVIGLSVNTRTLTALEAEKAVRAAEEEFGLPSTDVVRYGAEKLVDASIEAHELFVPRGDVSAKK